MTDDVFPSIVTLLSKNYGFVTLRSSEARCKCLNVARIEHE